MTPSAGPQRTPQFTLEPSPSNKEITSIHQWASAFNIFVSVYAERLSSETLHFMKYCEVSEIWPLNQAIGFGITNNFVI